eukprot:7218247-Heterocapsa_arctica.AAC.1
MEKRIEKLFEEIRGIYKNGISASELSICGFAATQANADDMLEQKIHEYHKVKKHFRDLRGWFKSWQDSVAKE